jgi:hypothetical protein
MIWEASMLKDNEKKSLNDLSSEIKVTRVVIFPLLNVVVENCKKSYFYLNCT